MKNFLKYFIQIALLPTLFSWTIPKNPEHKQRQRWITNMIDLFIAINVGTDADNHWSTPMGQYYHWKAAEFYEHYRNPWVYLYDNERDYTSIEGIGAQGERITKHIRGGFVYWTDHHIGTGTGTFLVNSMSGYSNGDRILIMPGTYSGYEIGIIHMHDVSVFPDFTINLNPVIIFDSQFDLGDNQRVTVSGTGTNTTYGYQFTGTTTTIRFALPFPNIIDCVVDHVSATGANNAYFIDLQNQQNTAYDGVNASTKTAVRLHMAFLKMDNEGAFIQNFKGQFNNVMDSCTFTNIIVTHNHFVQWVHHTSWYHDTVSWMNSSAPSTPTGTDEGFFFLLGCGWFHHNIRSSTGLGWGWYCRIFHKSLNGHGDVTIYSVINDGNIGYGAFETRLDTNTTSDLQTYWGGKNSLGNPRFFGGDVRIINCTVGNMRNDNGFITPVYQCYGGYVNYYPFGNYHKYVVNNLRYHAFGSSGGIHDSNTTSEFVSGFENLSIVSNNYYYVDAIASNVLNDTGPTWTLKTGWIGIHSANPYFRGAAGSDVNGDTYQSPNPSAGAVEVFNAPSNRIIYDRPTLIRN